MASLLMGLMVFFGFVWTIAGGCMYIDLHENGQLVNISLLKRAVVLLAGGPGTWTVIICCFVFKALEKWITDDEDSAPAQGRTHQ